MGPWTRLGWPLPAQLVGVPHETRDRASHTHHSTTSHSPLASTPTNLVLPGVSAALETSPPQRMRALVGWDSTATGVPSEMASCSASIFSVTTPTTSRGRGVSCIHGGGAGEGESVNCRGSRGVSTDYRGQMQARSGSSAEHSQQQPIPSPLWWRAMCAHSRLAQHRDPSTETPAQT